MKFLFKCLFFNRLLPASLIFFSLFITSEKTHSQENTHISKQPNCEEKNKNDSYLNQNSDSTKVENSEEIEKEYFCKLDADRDGIITFEEYQIYLKLEKSNKKKGDASITMQDPESELGSEEKPNEEKPNGLDKIAQHVSIRQSFLNGDSLFGSGSELLNTDLLDTSNADPATITYTFNNGEDNFTLDAAIIFKAYDGTFNQGLIDRLVKAQANGTTYEQIEDSLGFVTGLTIAPTIEAHVSSSDTAVNNSLQFHIPFVLRFTDAKPIAQLILDPGQEPESPFLLAHHFIGAPKYEADRDFTTEVIGFDLLYTPTIPPLGMGTSIPLGSLEFRWRPLLGIEFGHVLDDGDNLPTLPVDNFVRATARLRAQLAFKKSFVLSSDYIFRLDLTGENKISNYLDLSAIYYLDDKQRISLGTSYKVGENSPRFENNEEISVFLGFKF